MADEQIRDAELLLQIDQQVQDLRLHRDVERRNRLVEHQQFGIERQRARDADALALAAGELMRMAAGCVGRQADLGQEIGNAVAPLGAASDPMDVERLGDQRPDGPAWIKRCQRILKHHLNIAAMRAQLVPGQPAEIDAAEPHAAALGLDQARDRAPQGGLAAAGLTDQAQRLAGPDRE